MHAPSGISDKIFCGGAGGVIKVLDSRTLSQLATFSTKITASSQIRYRTSPFEVTVTEDNVRGTSDTYSSFLLQSTDRERAVGKRTAAVAQLHQLDPAPPLLPLSWPGPSPLVLMVAGAGQHLLADYGHLRPTLLKPQNRNVRTEEASYSSSRATYPIFPSA